MSLTLLQRSNFDGFPKAGELIEVTGTHLLEASDRALLNTLLQRAHDSGKLTEVDAEWELTFSELRQGLSRHESNDRVRASLASALIKIDPGVLNKTDPPTEFLSLDL